MELAAVQELVGEVFSVWTSPFAGRDELSSSLAGLARVQACLEGVKAGLAARLAEVCSFPEAAIADATRTSVRDAGRVLERAATLETVPEFADALGDARVAAGHVDALGRVLRQLEPEQRPKLLARTDRLLGVAERGTPDDFARTLRLEAARLCSEGDAEERLARQRRDTRLRTWVDQGSGMWCLRGRFDPASGLVLSGRLDATVSALFAEATPVTCPADPGEKQDHLRALALMALSDGTAPRSGRPELVVVIDTTTGNDNGNDDGDGDGDGGGERGGGDGGNGDGGSGDGGSGDSGCRRGGGQGRDGNGGDRDGRPPPPERGPRGGPRGGVEPSNDPPTRDNNGDGDVDIGEPERGEPPPADGVAAGGMGHNTTPPPDCSNVERLRSDVTNIQLDVPRPARDRPRYEDLRAAVLDILAAHAGISWPAGWDIDWGLPVELPRSTLDQLIARADIHGIIVHDGVILHAPGRLDLGRTTRIANRAQRRALRALYKTCAIPDCQVRYDHCKLHHVIWWRHGGRTDLENLLPLCDRHHHRVHDDGWQLTLGPRRELTAELPDGTRYTTGPPQRGREAVIKTVALRGSTTMDVARPREPR